MTMRSQSGFMTLGRWTIPLAVLLAATLVLGMNPDGLTETLHRTSFDSYQRISPRPYTPSAVRVVLVGPVGSARIGPWPWPAEQTNTLLQALADEGVKAVVIPVSNSDTEAAMAGSRLISVAGATLSAPRKEITTPEERPFLSPPRTGKTGWVGRLEPFGMVPDFSQLRAPTGAKLIGTGQLVPDSDGVLRRAPVVLRWQGQPIPSLAAQCWRLMNGGRQLTLHSDDGAGHISGHVGLKAADTGAEETGLSPDGSFRIAYAQSHPAGWTVMALAALTHSVQPGSLRNTIVFIGQASDTVQTPLGEKPLVAVQAEAAENLLLSAALSRPGYVTPGELLTLLILGAIGIFIFTRYGLPPALIFTGLLILAALCGGWLLYRTERILTDPLSISLGLTITALTCVAIEIRQWVLRRRKIIITFGGRLPAARIRTLLRQPDFTYAPVSRQVAYMSCGWREEGVNGQDHGAFMLSRAEVITRIADTILQNGGLLDAVTGDEITAVWNTPLDDSDPMHNCCRTAVALQSVFSGINAQDADKKLPIRCSIGLSSGEVIAAGFISPVGTMGYSVGGRCVRHAKLLRQNAVRYGYEILASAALQSAAAEYFAFLEVDQAVLPHADGPTRIYALAGNRTMRANPRLRAQATFHTEIFSAIHQRQWAKARTLIGLCRKLSGASDALYDLHLARIQEMERNPPPPDWDGAFRMPVL